MLKIIPATSIEIINAIKKKHPNEHDGWKRKPKGVYGRRPNEVYTTCICGEKFKTELELDRHIVDFHMKLYIEMTNIETN